MVLYGWLKKHDSCMAPAVSYNPVTPCLKESDERNSTSLFFVWFIHVLAMAICNSFPDLCRTKIAAGWSLVHNYIHVQVNKNIL